MSSTKPQRIVFTGGGSAGHVTPNLALIKLFQQHNWRIAYIGSYDGIEKTLITKTNVPYYPIHTGKLRRYFSWRNFLDPFKVLIGIMQAFWYCFRLKPKVIFSKGGFVAFPVVVAAWLNRIPVIAHESDLTPGLANRLSFPFARKICVTFEKGVNYFKNTDKVLVTGTPIRDELFQGDAGRGKMLCGFDDKPVIFVFGGGLGAGPINQVIRDALTQLLEHYNVIHLCGKGKTEPSYDSRAGYKQFDYVHEELPDLMACADVVVSRAGANSIYELLALQKPHILIPLSKKASRGDQIDNAKHFAELGVSTVIAEEDLTSERLLQQIDSVFQDQADIRKRIQTMVKSDSKKTIYQLVLEMRS